MLEKFNHFWDKNHDFLIFFVFICLVIHWVRQHQKYKKVPHEIASKLWYDVYLMHSSVNVLIEEQVLSIKKARYMIVSLENIKLNKNRLETKLKFTTKLHHFDALLNQYILFLNDLINTHQSKVKHEEIDIKIVIQDKTSIHHHFKKQLKILEKELYPTSQ